MAMMHDLNDLFRQRFQGHEAPVPPGTWQGIQAQLTATPPAPEGGDKVADLFRERFQGHEMAVDPAVWQGVATQLGHAATGTAAATGLWGWVAAGVAVVAIGAGAYLLTDNASTEAAPEQAVAEVPATPSPSPSGNEVIALVPAVPEERRDAEVAAQEPVHAEPDAPATTGQPVAHQPVDAAVPGGASEEPLSAIATISPMPMVPAPVAPAENPTLVEAIVSEMTAQADAAVEAEKEGRGQDPVVDTATPDEPMPDQPVMSDPPKLFLPNTFTPNGDGHNDLYSVGGLEYFDQVLVRIYSVKDNRLVFSTNSNEPWSGNDCGEGYYLVAVEAVAPGGRLVTEGKVVFLNRNRLN